jgi:hypothetical protein
MKLTHNKTDTWTAEDGTLFLDQQQAERYVAHRQLTATIMERFALDGWQELIPCITVSNLADFILSLTFDKDRTESSTR